MANFRAIHVVCKAITELLRNNHNPADFTNQLDFEVYVASNFAQPMNAGVSLFLYRITPNVSHRTPAGRIAPDGRRYRTKLPLDLHVLLTMWGQDHSLQHTIAGWVMRTLEDSPLLPAGFLNTVAADVFKPDETAEVVLSELSVDDLFRIWDSTVSVKYHLSLPYTVRMVVIESDRVQEQGKAVQEREFGYGLVEKQ